MKNDLETEAGRFMKSLSSLHDIEHKLRYHLHETTFFQKVVPKEILEKGVRIKPKDYFKGLAFVSYYCNIIEGNSTLCDSLVDISKKLREKEKQSGLDGGASYLSLKSVMLEAVLESAETNKSNIKSRYDQAYSKIKKADDAGPFYIAMGTMLLDTLNDKRKPIVSDISALVDYHAIIFTDEILSELKNPTEIKRIETFIKKKNYLEASIAAMNAMTDVATRDKLLEQLGDDYNDPTHP